jgi:GAF domain-containing protein
MVRREVDECHHREGARMIASDRLAHVFVEVAGSLVADFDVVAFLHLVAARAAEVAGCSQAGLVLADEEGRLGHIGSSDHNAMLLELVQVQGQQGPCRDCYLTGAAVVATDLTAAAQRWPQFAPQAVCAGFRSVHSFPMRLRERVIGALDVFGHEPEGLGAEVVAVVQALADVATIALVQDRAIARADLLNEQLQAALDSRIVVEQAKGAIAAALGVDVAEAFELMRREARSARVPLTDYARELLRHPARIGELAPDA